ncbi:MAG: hypothetical protein AAF962_17185 [Actinomycetota bacterium]
MAEAADEATLDGAGVLAEAGAALADAVDAATGDWITSCVTTRLGRPLAEAERVAVDRASGTARAEEVVRLRELLALDLEAQWTNPLAILRTLVTYPTAILRDAGAAAVERDDHAMAMAPDDVYDLTPAAFADFGPTVHEAGLIWGAAKAHLHLRRRKQAEAGDGGAT